MFPPSCFYLRQTMVEVMKIMGISFKKTHECIATLSASKPSTCHCPPMPLLETPGPSQESLGQSLVGSTIRSLGSWCAQGFVCALQGYVSPVLWKFYNQIPLASKVNFPGSSHSLCHIARLGNLFWVLKFSYDCENLFGNCSAVCGLYIVVLQWD